MSIVRDLFRSFSALRYYRSIAKSIAKSDLFDSSWYRKTQVQGISRLIDPIFHYLIFGAKKFLDPAADFHTRHYVFTNHDVRKSMVNPLFHYLRYGQSEYRSPLRSVVQTRDHIVPESTELETFISPNFLSPRVTLVIDNGSPKDAPIPTNALIRSAKRFADKHGRHLRVIFWRSEDTAGEELIEPVPGVSVVEATRTNPAPTFEIASDEYFIASSTTAEMSLRFTAPKDQLFTIKNEKSVQIMRSKTTPSFAAMTESTARNSKKVVLPHAGKLAIRPDAAKKTLLIIGDVVSQPVQYILALEAIDKAFLMNGHLMEDWEIIVCGRGVEPLLVAGSIAVPHSDHLNINKLSGIDLVISAIEDQEIEGKLVDHGLNLFRGQEIDLPRELTRTK